MPVVGIIGIVALATTVICLLIYNMNLHKKLNKFMNKKQRIKNLSVVQDFMTTVGEDLSVDQKIKRINDILIEKYDIKYSTIVVFDGTEYVVKASNVEPKHWNSLKSLHSVDIFQDSISTATPKYITVNKEGEQLPYQQSEFGRAKSAIFFPLYIDNVYIGYWIIENAEMHAFDNIDLSIIDVVKENIITVLKTIAYQNTMEGIVRKDLFTGLASAEYLYGEGKLKLDKYISSQICMFKIVNLDEVNETYNRKTGNSLVAAVANVVRNNLAS